MKDKTIKVYEFKELSEEVKRKVLQKHSDINVDYDWYDFVYDGFREELKEYGLSCKTFYWDMDRENYMYLVDLHIEDDRVFYKSANVEKFVMALKLSDCDIDYIDFRGNTRTYHDCQIEVNYGDESQFESDNNVIVEMQDEIKRFIDNLTTKFLRILREEYDYRCSDEAISETLEANEYEFDETGRII